MCSQEVCASNTRSRGASKIRVMTISRSDGVVTVSLLLSLSPIALLLSSTLELLQVLVQSVVALFPEPPVRRGPLRDLPERTSLEPGGPPLPFPAPRDQPRPLEHLQVLGDRRQAHLEWRRQLSHRGLPSGEPREDGPPPGYRPVNRMANQAMMTTTIAAIHRKNSTMKWGITRSHFTSGSHRFRSRVASG